MSVPVDDSHHFERFFAAFVDTFLGIEPKILKSWGADTHETHEDKHVSPSPISQASTCVSTLHLDHHQLHMSGLAMDGTEPISDLESQTQPPDREAVTDSSPEPAQPRPYYPVPPSAPRPPQHKAKAVVNSSPEPAQPRPYYPVPPSAPRPPQQQVKAVVVGSSPGSGNPYPSPPPTPPPSQQQASWDTAFAGVAGPKKDLPFCACCAAKTHRARVF